MKITVNKTVKITLKKTLKNLLLLSLITASPLALEAATVSAVKDKKVLISLDGDSANPGDEFFLVNPETNKRAGLIKIVQVKSGKAVAMISKGKAQKGYLLQPRSSSGSEAGATAKKPTAKKDGVDYASAFEESTGNRTAGILRNLRDSYGIMGGIQMNDMTSVNTTATNKMTGMGFNIGGFYSYAFGNSFALEASSYFEQFSAKASGNTCGGGSNPAQACSVDINYLSFYGLGKWYAYQSTFRAWVGAGAGGLLALSKSSTAINAEKVSTNQVFLASFGLDYQLNRKMYIPASFSYVMFPDSDTVKASDMQFKIGFAWNL